MSAPEAYVLGVLTLPALVVGYFAAKGWAMVLSDLWRELTPCRCQGCKP